MDDPWGSPWADEIQPPAIATKEKEKDNGAAKQKPPANPTTLGLEVKTNSPWDDEDDAFGEWAAVPTVEEARGNQLKVAGPADIWESRSNGHSTGEVKGEDPNELDLDWGNSTSIPDDRVPKLAPSLISKSVEIAREHSPDPWAMEAMLNAGHNDEDTAQFGINDRSMEDMLEDLHGGIAKGVGDEEAEAHNRPLPEPAEMIDGGEADKSGPESARTIGPEALPESPKVITGTDTTEERSLESATPDEHQLVADPSPVVVEVNGHDTGLESSRPSSSPSDRSHHDEMLPESPRTSLDEEPKRPHAARKVSSKIQELVEHFDGLAKQEEAVIDPDPSRSRSGALSAETETIIQKPEEPGPVHEKVEAEEDDEDDDFGDFEDGQSEVEDSIEKRPSTPTPTQNQITSNPTSKQATPEVHISPPRSQHVTKDYGRVVFAVDASALDIINSLSDTNSKEDEPVEKIFIMDTIPYDSFASTEERKTWYRISRYGSMRKHNSGGDESYTRINWPQSQIRDETLKTVARWMEEDRISGRVVLGGGSKGSSIFGWNDPNAPAVPLASVFAAKRCKKTPPAQTSEVAQEVRREGPKGLARERSSSVGRSTFKTRRRNSSKSSSISEIQMSTPQISVANFGWNASPTTTSQSPFSLSKAAPQAVPTTVKPTSLPQQPAASNSQPPSVETLMPVEAMQRQQSADLTRPNNVLKSIPAMTILSPPPVTIPSEEDDWGEMQSSPVVGNAPALPPSQRFQHNNPETVSGTFSPPLTSLPFLSTGAQSQPIRGHKPAMSLDDILVPKPWNPMDSKSDPPPSKAFTATSPSSSFTPIGQPSPTSIAVDSATSNSDPWASADFSFFDSPVVPGPVPSQTVKPFAKPPLLKPVSSAKTAPASSPLRHGKTRQEIEQDETVESIVRNLPDLSYMLRR